MEDLESPSTAAAPATTSLAQGWQLYLHCITWKTRSTWFIVIGCAAIIAVSYTALLPSSTSNLVDAPASTPSFLPPPPPPPPSIRSSGFLHHDGANSNQTETEEVKEVFERAAMPNKTLIITTLNAAWAEEGTMIDMFLESFRNGEGTLPLLAHVVIVCLDSKAFQRCLHIHPHCLLIKTEGVDFSGQKLLRSTGYTKLVWRHIEFLTTVLQMNYSFIYTDTDVLWFRNPFLFLQNDPEADFQVACDHYIGRPRDVGNAVNTGFIYVRASTKTVMFYKYWFEERKRNSHMHDQDVLDAIKSGENFTRIGMTMRFIDPQFMAAFCTIDNTDMTKAITMHATCCKGLEAKLQDLRMMLDGWKEWHAQNLPMPTSMVLQNQQNVTALATPVLTSSHNVKKDPHFKKPTACPQSWSILP